MQFGFEVKLEGIRGIRGIRGISIRDFFAWQSLVSAQHYVQFPGFEEVPTGLGAVTTAQWSQFL